MQALIYHGPKNLSLEERPYPVFTDKDVVVKIARAGICGTDLPAYLYDGKYVAIFPECEFGHEMVGTVCEVGKNVTGVSIGDRVFINPMYCKKEGAYKTDTAGAFSEYVCVENAAYDYNLYHLDDSVSFDEAVVAEPFSVGTGGKNAVHTKPEEHVVIYGAGTIGLCCLNALIGMGCKQPVVVDINDARLALAEEMGAVGFNPAKGDITEFLSKHFGTTRNVYGQAVGDVDVFVDCAGASSIPPEVLSICKNAARLSIVAVHKAPIEINFSAIMANNVEIKGSCGYNDADIREVLDNLNTHRTKISKIVTHHFPHCKAVEAFATAADPSTGAIKVVIDYE